MGIATAFVKPGKGIKAVTSWRVIARLSPCIQGSPGSHVMWATALISPVLMTQTPWAGRWHSVNDLHTRRAIEYFCSKYNSLQLFLPALWKRQHFVGKRCPAVSLDPCSTHKSSSAPLCSDLGYADWCTSGLHTLPVCIPRHKREA